MTIPSSRTGVPGFDQFFSGKVREGDGVRTGLAELDEMLHAGFTEGDMVAGSAGCGKATLALRYLANGVTLGELGVYLTFEKRR